MTKAQIIEQLQMIGAKQGEAMKRKDRALSDKFNIQKWQILKDAAPILGEIQAYEVYTEAYRQASGFYN